MNMKNEKNIQNMTTAGEGAPVDNSRKKRMIRWLIIGIIVLAIGSGVGVYGMEYWEEQQEKKADTAQTTLLENQAAENNVTLIGQDAATEAALTAAGAQESDVKKLSVKLDTDNEYNTASQSSAVTYVYEVSFRYDGLEYDFDVDGESGSILSTEAESIYD